MILSLVYVVNDRERSLSELCKTGSTLGDEYQHRFRAEFFQPDRLFIRYHKAGMVIVYAFGERRGHDARLR